MDRTMIELSSITKNMNHEKIFRAMVISKEKNSRGRVKHFFFVTFNVIIDYIFFRKLYLSGRPEDMKILFLDFNQFRQLFGRFDILFLQKNKKTPQKTYTHKKKPNDENI